MAVRDGISQELLQDVRDLIQKARESK
jgi:hypothetical protein